MKISHLVFLCITLLCGRVLATENVRLEYARLYQSALTGSCDVCTTFSGVVKVKNIAFEKVVNIHYSTPFSGGWKKTAATYIGPAGNNDEYWEFRSPELGSLIEFAIEYQVAGQTFWDNNNAADYVVQAEFPLIRNTQTQVLLSRDALFEVRRFPNMIGMLATIHLHDAGPDKTVKVRYSTDGWQSFHEKIAGFNRLEANGMERWSFALELPLETESLVMAVAYSVNGETHWDNNLGRNYPVFLP